MDASEVSLGWNSIHRRCRILSLTPGREILFSTYYSDGDRNPNTYIPIALTTQLINKKQYV